MSDQDLAERAARLYAELTRDQDRGLRALNNAYERALRRATDRALERVDPDGELGALTPTPQVLAALARGSGDLAGALAILEDVTDTLRAEIERENVWARRYFVAAADALEVDTLALEQLLSTASVEAVTGLGAYHVRQIHQAVIQHVLGRRRASQLRRRLAELADVGARQAERTLTDAVMTYSRGVHDAKARAHGYRYFLYTGPKDSITRPFCNERVGKVYTRGEISRMDNGQTGDVMHTCGGYRCRHHWRAVKRSWYSAAKWAEMRRT